MKSKKFFVLGCLLLFFSVVASAEGDSSGILDRIILFLKSLFGMGGDSASEEVVCNPPYIQVGAECCLDLNSNNICDEDDKVKTTTITVTTTVSATTLSTTTQTITTTSLTTTSSSSMTMLVIRCTVNSDCGLRREEKVCYRGDVYMKSYNPLCKNPGEANAYCLTKEAFVGASLQSEPKPTKECMNGCKDGDCL